MKKNVNFLEGPIFPSLTKLALPIMATSLIQMAYNMIDMIWIGRISSNAVAAVGAAGMYMWLSNGLATLAKMGAQVKVGYSIGADNQEAAVSYAKNALQLVLVFGVLFGILCVIFADPLISFFRLSNPDVISDAKIYLQITCGLVIFSFVNQVFTGIMTAMGNSQSSFLATAVGLVINMILDPVLIFGIGPFPRMGVMGAAIATVFAQLVVTMMFLVYAMRDEFIFRRMNILQKPNLSHIADLVQIGLPTALQSLLFTGISMIIARLVASFGDAAIAVQKVGSQIESISWMTADGFAAAVNSFLAQNFGAGNYTRIKKGYASAMGVVLIWGTFCTLLLILFPAPIFRIFILEDALLPMGIEYLRILGVSQLLMCIEITTAGAFAGLGKTIPPSVTGILLTSARIPMAFLLTGTALGLNGIWWSVTISSILKGIVLFSWFMVYLRRTRFGGGVQKLQRIPDYESLRRSGYSDSCTDL